MVVAALGAASGIGVGWLLPRRVGLATVSVRCTSFAGSQHLFVETSLPEVQTHIRTGLMIQLLAVNSQRLCCV
jgi:hypothetical protein